MRRGSFLRWWLPPVVWGAVILAATWTPRLSVAVPHVPSADKFAHLFVYFVLGLLVMRALRRGQRRSRGRSLALTLLWGGVFAAVQEAVQAWIPGRGAEMSDFVANMAGLGIASAVFLTWDRLAAKKASRRNKRAAQTVTHSAHTRKEMTTMAEALHLDEDSFDSEVLQSDKPALIDFWAPWCGPCQMMGPTIDKLAGEYEGKAVVGKINVDDTPDLASKYGIRSIPALLFFKDGEVVDQLVGVQSEDVLKEKLDSLE